MIEYKVFLHTRHTGPEIWRSSTEQVHSTPSLTFQFGNFPLPHLSFDLTLGCKSRQMNFRSLLALLSLHRALAFPSGAGGCDAGNPLGGFHISRPQTTGSLSVGGFEILLNDFPVSPITPTVFSPGGNNTITLRSTGTDNVFRGYLLRFDVGNTDTGGLIPDAEGAVSSFCIAQNVSSVTHTNNNDKTEITATIDIDEDVTDLISLQVTVVVANVPASSEWYFSNYMLQQADAIDPPTNPPNPMFDPCPICGEGMEVTNPDGLVAFPAQPIFTCATVQEAGEMGFIDGAFCGIIQPFLIQCGCAPVTVAPVTAAPVTPAPVTPAPVTPAPVTEMPIINSPAPVMSCGFPNDECQFNSDCCSNSCRAKPGQVEGVCVSTKTANKNDQKLGAGMGGAGNRAKRFR